jgi:hypothetical protein
MKNVLMRNSIVIFLSLLLFGCVKNEKQKKRTKPLTLDINFKEFGFTTLAYDEKKMEIDTAFWKYHEIDSTILFKINLKNITEKSFYIRTHLVANNIPFLIKYTDKDDKIILEIIQQFNTVCSDSLIFEKNNLKTHTNSPILNKGFNICYEHDGMHIINKIAPIYNNDTIVISH